MNIVFCQALFLVTGIELNNKKKQKNLHTFIIISEELSDQNYMIFFAIHFRQDVKPD